MATIPLHLADASTALLLHVRLRRRRQIPTQRQGGCAYTQRGSDSHASQLVSQSVCAEVFLFGLLSVSVGFRELEARSPLDLCLALYVGGAAVGSPLLCLSSLTSIVAPPEPPSSN